MSEDNLPCEQPVLAEPEKRWEPPKLKCVPCPKCGSGDHRLFEERNWNSEFASSFECKGCGLVLNLSEKVMRDLGLDMQVLMAYNMLIKQRRRDEKNARDAKA